MLWLVPLAAHARIYEAFIDIETEEELYDMFRDGAISEATLEAMLELLQRGVDLNQQTREELYTLPNLTYGDIDRILTYREEIGFIVDPGDLVAAGALTQRKLDAIAPFLVLSEDDVKKSDVSGYARIESRLSGKNDHYPPASALQAEVRTLRNLEIGMVGILQRNSVRKLRYDEGREGLSARAPSVRAVVPKFYVQWDDEHWAVIAGTYRIGFGQRLTFDATNQITPYGFYGDIQFRRGTDLTSKCKESAGELGESPCTTAGLDGVRVTPDYKWTNRLAGVAIGAKDLKLGKGHLDMWAWGSYQPNSIFQTETVDGSKCADARDDDDPDCASVPVYVRLDDPTAATSTFRQHTLPGAYAEALGGANITYHFDDRSHLGVTGYGATVNWLIEGIDLDFQEFARTPSGGPYGAVGVDGSVGFGVQDFSLEVTRSFDSQVDGGGGYGGVLRSVTGTRSTEIEVSLRYYDKKFSNPYARPISAADELDGLRARDEAGIRILSETQLADWVSLRLSANVWRAPSEDIYEGEFLGRTDFDLTDRVRYSVWGKYRNKNLANNSRLNCFDGKETDSSGEGPAEEVPCSGEKIFAATQLAIEASRKLALTMHYQHEWVDDPSYDTFFRQDLAATFTMTIKPIEPFRIRLRTRYDFEDIRDNSSKEHVLWAYLDNIYTFNNRDQVRLRYDLRVWLDGRDSTQERRPSPEHWLWLEYRARF